MLAGSTYCNPKLASRLPSDEETHKAKYTLEETTNGIDFIQILILEA